MNDAILARLKAELARFNERQLHALLALVQDELDYRRDRAEPPPQRPGPLRVIDP